MVVLRHLTQTSLYQSLYTTRMYVHVRLTRTLLLHVTVVYIVQCLHDLIKWACFCQKFKSSFQFSTCTWLLFSMNFTE